ncbi:hypothetical protein [Rhizobium sp. G21]|uniref:hypothetical protein n=1 Tax=Rhizobium sp. G21 TaxID=2758439 RepID=UPI001FEF8D27|nr:hypothetical protein [Rhizobium sp. G21]
MIEVHAFATPNSVKALIALEELGLPYDLKPINVRLGAQKAAAFLAQTRTARCRSWSTTASC